MDPIVPIKIERARTSTGIVWCHFWSIPFWSPFFPPLKDEKARAPALPGPPSLANRTPTTNLHAWVFLMGQVHLHAADTPTRLPQWYLAHKKRPPP